MNKVLSIALGLTITVILTATLLIPVVNDAQRTAGEEIEYQNGNLYGYHLGDSSENATLTFNYTDGWKYNGEPLTVEGMAIVSDYVAVNIFDSGNRGIITTPIGQWELRTSWRSSPATLTFINGVVTYDFESSTTPEHYSGAYSWLIQPKEGGEWQTKSGLYTVYANSISDVMAVGYYSTGNNSTGYSFVNGNLSVSADYETSVSYDAVKVAGTTDVYQIRNLYLHVGDESFTPWFVLVKSEIIGHEDKGAAYTIYGVIPVIVIVAILALAVSVVRSRNE